MPLDSILTDRPYVDVLPVTANTDCIVHRISSVYTCLLFIIYAVMSRPKSQGQGQCLDLRGQGHSTSLVQTFLILADLTVTSLTQRKDVHNII